jgi:hypothetical protein
MKQILSGSLCGPYTPDIEVRARAVGARRHGRGAGVGRMGEPSGGEMDLPLELHLLHQCSFH